MSRTTRRRRRRYAATLLSVFDGGPIRFADYNPQRRGDTRRIGDAGMGAPRQQQLPAPTAYAPTGTRGNSRGGSHGPPVCPNTRHAAARDLPGVRSAVQRWEPPRRQPRPARREHPPEPRRQCANPLDQEHRSPYPPLCSHPYADMTSETCTQPAVARRAAAGRTCSWNRSTGRPDIRRGGKTSGP